MFGKMSACLKRDGLDGKGINRRILPHEMIGEGENVRRAFSQRG